MEILVKMNVPEWILRLIISYLEQRLMYVSFRGQVSTTKDMNGVFHREPLSVEFYISTSVLPTISPYIQFPLKLSHLLNMWEF